MGGLHAWQDAVGSSRPSRRSGERRSVPGLRGEFVCDRRRCRGRRRDEGLVIAGFARRFHSTLLGKEVEVYLMNATPAELLKRNFNEIFIESDPMKRAVM